MPAVARGDQDRVDIGAGQQLAIVAEEDAIVVAVVRIDQLLAGLATAGLDVADGDALDVGSASMLLRS